MTTIASADRELDLIVFGATGFVGRLIAAYLARSAPAELRWGIAGRSRPKLAATAEACGRPELPLVLASVEDPASLVAMARRTRVLLTTVGPYRIHGEPVVAACVEGGAHYLDLTGEPAFVARVVERFHGAARAAGVAVIPCAGFDSIPADLGAYATVLQLPEDRPITVRAVMRGRGSFSGGTTASALGAMTERARGADRTIAPRVVDGRAITPLHGRVRAEPALGVMSLALPTIDGAIVRRSAGLVRRYGPDFRYRHAIATSRLGAVVTLAGLGLLVGAAQLAPVRRVIQRLRPPGSGPSEAERARSWFQMTFVGEAGDARVITEMRGGDPGYDETAKMVSEAAICLWRHGPRGGEGGVLTPAAALGDPLLARLGEVGLGVTRIA